jgi:glycine hydroxymethyltransferase
MTVSWVSASQTVVTSRMGTMYVWERSSLVALLPINPYPQTAKKKMTASSIYFQSFPYAISPDTHLIDYEALAKQAKVFKPRLIICGASAYPRDWDYALLKQTAEKEGAWLMSDIAHTSGLIAAQELNNPFEYCDVVTTTT